MEWHSSFFFSFFFFCSAGGGDSAEGDKRTSGHCIVRLTKSNVNLFSFSFFLILQCTLLNDETSGVEWRKEETN